jgi:hypothetical protein
MNTITSVTPTPGVSKTGKPWIRYDVTLDNGVQASGFDPVSVGEQVDLVQKGKFMNYLKLGAATPALPFTPPVIPPVNSVPKQAMTKDDYWERKEMRDREWQAEQTAQRPKIMRQHSQEMALRWFAIMGGIPGEVSEYTKKLRAMIDWFQRDIEYAPKAVEPAPEPDQEGPPL